MDPLLLGFDLIHRDETDAGHVHVCPEWLGSFEGVQSDPACLKQWSLFGPAFHDLRRLAPVLISVLITKPVHDVL